MCECVCVWVKYEQSTVCQLCHYNLGLNPILCILGHHVVVSISWIRMCDCALAPVCVCVCVRIGNYRNAELCVKYEYIYLSVCL